MQRKMQAAFSGFELGLPNPFSNDDNRFALHDSKYMFLFVIRNKKSSLNGHIHFKHG